MPDLICRLLLCSILWPIALPVALAADPAADAGRILAAMPSGSGAGAGEWIFARARELADADVARMLMQEAAERGGAAAARARLWSVRYWVTAGDAVRARYELDALGDLSAGDPLVAEARYWTARLRGVAANAAPGTDPEIPPWNVMSALAVLAQTPAEEWSLSAALSPEGDCRRWGLIGPWLWQLQRAPDAQLAGVVEQIARTEERALASAPEGALLEAERRAKTGSAPASVTPAARSAQQRYAVQIGSYDDQRIAQELLRELATHGFEGHLSVGLAAGQPPVYRVRLGPHDEIFAAESLGVRLSRELMLPYQIVGIP